METNYTFITDMHAGFSILVSHLQKPWDSEPANSTSMVRHGCTQKEKRDAYDTFSQMMSKMSFDSFGMTFNPTNGVILDMGDYTTA